MKDKDLLLLISVGVAVWYFSRKPAVSQPDGTLPTTQPGNISTGRPLIDRQPPSLYAMARDRRISGYRKTIKQSL